jgi:hypothetical protein
MKKNFKIHVKGQHYFVNQAGTLVPVWDLRSSGNPNAIVFGQKVKNAPSPNGPQNVDWLELKKLSGDLANLVYRVDTVKGQPPSTVSSSFDFVPVLSINMNVFVVHPRQLCNRQVYGELLYVFMMMIFVDCY